MWNFFGSLATGIAGLFGMNQSSNSAQANNAANIQMQRETNQMNVEEAAKNRQFQEQMSSTAYQRSMMDMKSAGLNPAAMFGSGAAASSPGGNVPQLTAPQARENPGKAFEGLGDLAGKMVNSAIGIKTMDKMTEEIANLQAQEAVTKARERYVRQATETEKHETLRRADVASITGLQLPRARLSAKEAEALLDLPPWLRDLVVQGQYVGGKASDTLSPLRDLVSSAGSVRRLFPSRTTRETSHVDTAGNRWDRFEDIWNNRIN